MGGITEEYIYLVWCLADHTNAHLSHLALGAISRYKSVCYSPTSHCIQPQILHYICNIIIVLFLCGSEYDICERNYGIFVQKQQFGLNLLFELRRFVYGLFIRIVTPLAVFAMHSWEIVALTTSDNRVRHIVSSQDDAVAGLLGR